MHKFYTSFKVNLLKIASNLLKEESDAQDAVQDTFLRLWKIRDKIKTEDEAKALAIRTTQNICIDKLRRKKIINFEPIDNYQNYRIDDSMQKNAEITEDYNFICSLIDQKLSPLQKKIIKMKEFEEKEIEEIALILDMKQAAVRMNLSRARKEIREIYLKSN